MSEADEVDIGDLLDQFDELKEMADTPEEREHIRETMEMAIEVKSGSVFGRIVRGYDRGDIAEALLGSLLFGIPMAVEGGTQEVGEFIATHPLYLVGTAVFTVGLVITILYVADIQDVRVHKPILGVIPRRLVGVVGTSLLTAILLLTAWGRVDWSEPWLAAATVIVAFVPMSIGAALGDILPGS